MALAFDAVSNGAVGQARSTTDKTWTHTPVGTPRAILVYIIQDVGTGDEVVGVTYGGVAMTRVRYLAGLAGTEDGAVYAYFLGTNVPTGAQTVSVDVDATGSDKAFDSISYTADADCAVEGHDGGDDSSGVNHSLTLVTGAGVETAVSSACHSGANAGGGNTAGVGYTRQNGNGIGWDFGTSTAALQTRDTNGTGGNIVVDWATSASVAFHWVAVAIKEVAGAPESKAGTDSATESEDAGIGLSGTDSATESEVAGISQSAIDSGTVSEAAQISQDAVDSATLSEAASVAEIVDKAGTDSAILAEQASVEIGQAGTDAVSLTDTGIVEAQQSAVDAVTVTETANVAVEASASDAFVLSEQDQVTSPPIDKAGTDSITLTDAAGIGVAGSDSATVSEQASVTVQAEGLDAASLGEMAVGQASLQDAEAWFIDDTGALAVTVQATDQIALGEAATGMEITDTFLFGVDTFILSELGAMGLYEPIILRGVLAPKSEMEAVDSGPIRMNVVYDEG